MKKHELFEALCDLDPKMVQETYDLTARKRVAKKKTAVSILSAAACLCLIALGVANLSVRYFAPGDSVKQPDGTSSLVERPATETPPSDGMMLVDGFQIRNGTSISYCGSGTSVTVPAQVQVLSAGTFDLSENAAEIQSLTLESENTKLDPGALRALSALREIHVKNGETHCEDLAVFMKMSVEEIVNSGFSLEYCYARHGGEPVYQVLELQDVYLNFSFQDVTVDGNPRSALSSDASPYIVEIRTKWERNDDGTELVVPRPDLKTENGIYCGMTGEELAKADDSYQILGINITEGGELMLDYRKEGCNIRCFLTGYSEDFYALEMTPETEDEWAVWNALKNRCPDGTVWKIELSIVYMP